MRACLLCALMLMTGCQTTGMAPQPTDEKPQESAFQPATFAGTPQSEVTTIHHLVHGLIEDMMASMRSTGKVNSVVVADFVFLDGQYDKSGLLGKQLAQSMMSELHQSGIKVLDHKVTDYIRVTRDGDLVLSRDYKELRPDVQAQFVIAGTLTRHQNGILVQARMVNLLGKDIVAAAQTLLPTLQVRALLASIGGEDMLPGSAL